jgi:hypothetical protein
MLVELEVYLAVLYFSSLPSWVSRRAGRFYELVSPLSVIFPISLQSRTTLQEYNSRLTFNVP